MEPQDEHSTEPSFTENEPEAMPAGSHAPTDESIHIEPETGAALLLSGNYSRSLADRVFSALSQDEIGRLSHGLLRLKATPEDKLERMWNKLTLLFTGDWREEDDLVEFIRSILRKGVRDEPALTPVQKLALLLLSLPEETSHRVSGLILSSLNRHGVADLTRELAHLLHYPNTDIHERVVSEFLAFCQARALRSTSFMSLRVMEMEAERLVRRNVSSCADIIQRLWLNEGETLSTFQDAARHQPEKLVEMLKDFAYGPAHYYYIPLAERAATFRVCLSPEACNVLDEALQVEEGGLPEPFVSPMRKEVVLREFLHRYYLEYMKLIPIVMQ
jgi:hypothetical protein